MAWLDGKVVAVTGAARGIGRGIAMRAAAEGARVIVADFGGALGALAEGSALPAEAVVAEIRAEGGEAIACAENVATMEGAQRVVEAALSAYGRLDGLVCCAGLLTQKHVWEMSEGEWDDVILSHLKGHFACTRAASPVMMRQKAGSIVHFSSASALVTPPLQPSYAAAKSGILAFSRSCAIDLAEHQVRVNCVMPGASTRMTDEVYRYHGVTEDGDVSAAHPLARMASGLSLKSDRAAKTWRDPANVAPFVIFLLSHRAEGVNGQTFAVVGDQVTHVRERSYGQTIRSGRLGDIDDLVRRFEMDLRPELELRTFPWPPP